MFQSYCKSALAQQIDMACQYFFSVLEVVVDDFPGIGAVLARPEVVTAIPVVFEVGELVDEFPPTVINTDLYLKEITPYNPEILIEHIAVWRKGIGNIEEWIEENMNLALRSAAILIGEID
jgi:hypothetical protein